MYLENPPSNSLGLPNLGFGLGLRPQHFRDILDDGARVDWFEIISENFIDNHGFARHALDRIRADHPIVMHGVSLSIGSADPLNRQYLQQLKTLADDLQPAWISDHLCWTGVLGVNSHDLLPLPFDEPTLRHVSERVMAVQEFLGRPLIIENPSSYVEWAASTMSEWAFLAELCQRSDCGLLLDLNNIYVSSRNHGFDPLDYVNGIPMDRVVQVHLAGPTDYGDYLIDTHNNPVPRPVWGLYKECAARGLSCSTLLEWDEDIPSYPELLQELYLAKAVLAGDEAVSRLPVKDAPDSVSGPINYQMLNV